MATVHDVAKYVLQQTGSITTMKLQKLVYFCQAWGLVWDEEPLFNERIEAWVNGPVVPDLYHVHKGQFRIEEWPYGDIANLNPAQLATINAVIEHYNKFTSQTLSDLTYQSAPLINAREGLEPNERGSSEISPVDMAEYYGSLPPTSSSRVIDPLNAFF